MLCLVKLTLNLGQYNFKLTNVFPMLVPQATDSVKIYSEDVFVIYVSPKIISSKLFLI